MDRLPTAALSSTLKALRCSLHRTSTCPTPFKTRSLRNSSTEFKRSWWFGGFPSKDTRSVPPVIKRAAAAGKAWGPAGAPRFRGPWSRLGGLPHSGCGWGGVRTDPSWCLQPEDPRSRGPRAHPRVPHLSLPPTAMELWSPWCEPQAIWPRPRMHPRAELRSPGSAVPQREHPP